MVSRWRVSGVQLKALQRMAELDKPVRIFDGLFFHPFILEGCVRRKLAGKIEDPGGVVNIRRDIRWYITPKGREFLVTRVYDPEELRPWRRNAW